MPIPALFRALFLFLLLAPAGSGQGLIRPQPGANRYPSYCPATGRSPVQRLAAEARWIRNQVWTTGPVADAASFLLPRSYDVTSGYGFLASDYFTWMLENNDRYFQFDASHNDHRADAPSDHGNDAPIERVMMAWGSNSYDAATWALALAAANGCAAFSREERADFTAAVAAYLRFQVTASYPGGLQSYRAWDPAGRLRWHYGESGQDAAFGQDEQGRPLDARNAFHWQFAPARWQNPDPHWDPAAPPGALMNWPGWSVITGEEAWATFLGPLQVAYTLNRGRPGWARSSWPIPVPALLENACATLHAVRLMQDSVTGGVYRQVGAPDQPVDAQGAATSVENNWSLYAGLGFLERALVDLQAGPPLSLAFDPAQALATTRSIRQGLRSFFGNRALIWHGRGEPFPNPAAVDSGFFLQGTTGMAGAAVGVTRDFAPDVQTWGIATLLADRELERALEARCGPGFLDEMFDAVIHLSGYGEPLAGIGFYAQRPGAEDAQLSGEWTWGAINAAIQLADFHREPAHADPARVARLLAQAAAMIDGVDRLASHDYNPQGLKDGRDWVGYLYSNRRQWIPWGWYANPCPSQAATAWALLVNCGFNPFELGGGDHQATVRRLGLAGR